MIREGETDDGAETRMLLQWSRRDRVLVCLELLHSGEEGVCSRDIWEVGRLCRTCLQLEDEGSGRVRHDSWFLAWVTVWVVVAVSEKRNTGGGTGLEGRWIQLWTCGIWDFQEAVACVCLKFKKLGWAGDYIKALSAVKDTSLEEERI